MADRVDGFCPNCGTEVEADARFCPTCGQTLADGTADAADEDGQEQLELAAPDEADTRAIPPAPAWPPPPAPAAPEPSADEPEQPSAAEPAAPAAPEGPERGEINPVPPVPPPPDGAGDLPFTLPTTLSGWLIGAGSGFAALALLPGLGNLLNVLLFIALLGVTASVFLADRMPDLPRLRLGTLVVVMVALGVALDRSAFTVRGADTIFLMAMIVAAGGVLLLELDRDQPIQPPGGRS